MGSSNTAAFTGDITSDKRGTASMPIAGRPPLDSPTSTAAHPASQK
ncbi:hypothetical protein GALL_538130 [mine drainage metagenome]|uniref:Uncharacterized protein n=1 Tax=mine drainage metagenome TaxID=410659 RepID=A0A1J5PAZ3_9ZZZZ